MTAIVKLEQKYQIPLESGCTSIILPQIYMSLFQFIAMPFTY